MRNLQPILVKGDKNGKVNIPEINRQLQDIYRLLNLVDKKNNDVATQVDIGNLSITNILNGGVFKIGTHFRINEVGGSCVIEYSHDGNPPWVVAATLVENPGDEV